MRRTLVVSLLCLALGGCGDGGLSDLRTFVAQAGAGSRPVIPPIPKLKPHAPFQYAAAGLPDPFAPRAITRPPAKGGPNLGRPKQPLQYFPLDALKMVGTLTEGRRTWAVVVTPDGSVHRVTIGDYMGENYGKVVAITSDKIKVAELVLDPTGVWVTRDASLALADSGENKS